ncbi:MAG TPA: SpaH/EbpB family LPXTG-anchored major pilin [Marmoricola sp.]|jgi:fimbrial isopeptide formation D2 family protein/LPXTG-motif cell wall-anchored protein|nr:SpaH/EbpB family LPXTG-anchored major pilin [Marmoricola sp.]
MSQKFTGRLRRYVLAIAAAATVMVGLVPIASAASPSLPDPGQVGSLTIHKTQAGAALSGAPGAPIAGVTFSVADVTGIDLATNQGWQDAAALSTTFNADDAPGSIQAAGYVLAAATGSPVTTDAAGEASLSSLPLGLYLVTETQWPAGTTPSAPFLVSVPQTQPNGAGWLYNISVYPKNSVDGVTKSVDDASAISLGDPVNWTITGDVPNVEKIDGYKILDHLDAKLDYRSATVTLVDGTPVSAGSDYTVDFDSTTHTLTVTFTAAGRAVLAAHRATQVTVVVRTVVTAVGIVANTAVLYPNEHSFDIAPGQPGGPTSSPPVLTKWGSITVQKTDAAGKPLTGAVFSVYPTEADAQSGTHAIALAGQSSFPVDAQGRLTIAGLRYSDFADGVEVSPGTVGYQTYWLNETKAPPGYELLGEPVKFTVTAQTSAVGVDLVVTNVRTAVSPPNNCRGHECKPPHLGDLLPSTGGPRLALLVGGLLLLVGGFVIVARNRRREED